MTPYDDNIHDLFPPEPPDLDEPPRPYDDGPPPHWPAYAEPEPEPQPWWAAAEPWRAGHGRRNRVTHLVMVDGRLVDSWSEPAERSAYEHVAEWLDRERQPPRAYAAPVPRLPHEQALDWLDAVVGGRIALESLDDLPLQPVSAPDDAELPLASRHRLEAITRSLDAAAEEFWDDEVRHALGAVLAAVWAEAPELALRSKSSAHVAGGICWIVGRANDMFGGHGVTQTEVSKCLGLPALSASGTSLHHALRGLQPPYGSRPHHEPDLLPTGRADFLIASTRRRLIRLRGQALAARAQHVADQARKAGAVS